jgi:chorismate-pyruvate lyase
MENKNIGKVLFLDLGSMIKALEKENCHPLTVLLFLQKHKTLFLNKFNSLSEAEKTLVRTVVLNDISRLGISISINELV